MPDPADPDGRLTLYDLPDDLVEVPARLLLRGGSGLLVPPDLTDPVAAAAWTYDWPVETYRDQPGVHGEVSVLPVVGRAPRTAIPCGGKSVLRGDSGGHSYTLHASPTAYFLGEKSLFRMRLGTLTVPDGSEAHLVHPGHGTLTIAPGTYRVGRRRQITDGFSTAAD